MCFDNFVCGVFDSFYTHVRTCVLHFQDKYHLSNHTGNSAEPAIVPNKTLLVYI